MTRSPRRRRAAAAALAVAAASGLLTLPTSRAAFTSVAARPDSLLTSRADFACEAYAAEVGRTPGLVGFWRLGETGATAVDTAGTAGTAPGSYVGAPEQGVAAHSTSEADGAVHFATPGSYVEVGDVHDFAGAAAFTVSAWVRVDARTPDYRRIVDKEVYGGGGAERQGWGLLLDPDGQVGVERWRDGSADAVRSGDALTLGRWHHLAASFDGTELRLYVDGELRRGDPAVLTLRDTPAPLRFGALADDTGVPDHLPGALDDVALYDAALSGEQVRRHAAANCTYASVVRRTPGLASYWSLDQLGATAPDEIGGHTATQQGTVETGLPGALPADSRYAHGFDGTSGALVVGDVHDHAGGAPFSLEMWALAEPPVPGAYPRLLAKERRNGSRDGWLLTGHPDGSLTYEAYVGGVHVGGVGGPPLPAGSWHHIVVTSDGSTARIYYDGAEVGEEPAGAPPDTTAPLRIGSTGNGHHSFWRGRLDEVAIYTRALTPVEVAEHYFAR